MAHIAIFEDFFVDGHHLTATGVIDRSPEFTTLVHINPIGKRSRQSACTLGHIQRGTKFPVHLGVLKLLEVFLREMVVHPRLVAIQRLKRAGNRLTDFVSVEVRATATGSNLDGKFHANLLDKDIVADLTRDGRASLHGEARDSLVSDAKGGKDAWRDLNAVVRVR